MGRSSTHRRSLRHAHQTFDFFNSPESFGDATSSTGESQAPSSSSTGQYITSPVMKSSSSSGTEHLLDPAIEDAIQKMSATILAEYAAFAKNPDLPNNPSYEVSSEYVEAQIRELAIERIRLEGYVASSASSSKESEASEATATPKAGKATKKVRFATSTEDIDDSSAATGCLKQTSGPATSATTEAKTISKSSASGNKEAAKPQPFASYDKLKTLTEVIGLKEEHDKTLANDREATLRYVRALGVDKEEDDSYSPENEVGRYTQENEVGGRTQPLMRANGVKKIKSVRHVEYKKTLEHRQQADRARKFVANDRFNRYGVEPVHQGRFETQTLLKTNVLSEAEYTVDKVAKDLQDLQVFHNYVLKRISENENIIAEHNHSKDKAKATNCDESMSEVAEGDAEHQEKDGLKQLRITREPHSRINKKLMEAMAKEQQQRQANDSHESATASENKPDWLIKAEKIIHKHHERKVQEEHQQTEENVSKDKGKGKVETRK